MPSNTRPARPSAGAMRAAIALQSSGYSKGWRSNSCDQELAEIIDRETGLEELAGALALHMGVEADRRAGCTIPDEDLAEAWGAGTAALARVRGDGKGGDNER